MRSLARYLHFGQGARSDRTQRGLVLVEDRLRSLFWPEILRNVRHYERGMLRKGLCKCSVILCFSSHLGHSGSLCNQLL
jgi:hypothetical protein